MLIDLDKHFCLFLVKPDRPWLDPVANVGKCVRTPIALLRLKVVKERLRVVKIKKHAMKACMTGAMLPVNAYLFVPGLEMLLPPGAIALGINLYVFLSSHDNLVSHHSLLLNQDCIVLLKLGHLVL